LGAEILSEGDFDASALERTEGRGADVVLELVGAPHMPGNLNALASKGRVVIVSLGAGDTAEFTLRSLMSKRASLRGTVLRSRPLEEKSAAVRAFEHEVVPLLASGRIRPLIDSIFPAEQVTDALDHLSAPGKLGKILLEF